MNSSIELAETILKIIAKEQSPIHTIAEITEVCRCETKHFCPDCGSELEVDVADNQFYWCSECDKDFILLHREE